MPHSSVAVDPYAELEVPRDASQQQIKQAYRRIALASHPDRHSQDPTAAERFRRASQSYALLRNPERRLAFDKTGRWDDDQWEPELDAQLFEALEIFAHDFGTAVDIPVTDDRAPAHTGRVTMTVDVTYEEVERGGRRRIAALCVLCAGSGAREGSTHVRCTSCGGSGRLRQVESSFLGPKIHTERCESCHGTGRRPILVCPGCDGSGHAPGAEMVNVLIPRGIADGDTLASTTASGFRLVARLEEDQRWARDGADLYAIGRMPYEVAVLGGSIDIELPGRMHEVEVAVGTASGHRVRIPGQGLPRRDGSGRGDLILTLHVTVPEQVGRFERWWLKVQRGRSTVVARASRSARLSRLQAWAREIAIGQWRNWRAHHHRSSLMRIEEAAASLRSAAGLLSESERRLGPLLERGFYLIAPEAAVARGRLDDVRIGYGALARFVVDIILLTGMGAGLWALARFAGPVVATGGTEPWRDVLGNTHPALFALVPLMAGLGSGVLRAAAISRWIRRIAALPLGIAVGAAMTATGAAAYGLTMSIGPEIHLFLLIAMSVVTAFVVAITPFLLFLLADSIVDSARLAVKEASQRADKRTLRRYDVAAANLATHLEGTERAFRELLTQADDARHPLTSLLNSAADTLAAGDRHPRLRSSAVRAALALAGSIAITIMWLATTCLAVITAFTLVPEAATWMHLATAAAIAGLCTFGSIVPPALVDGERTHGLTTGLISVVAVLAIAGLLTAGQGTGWLAAGAATAALALSFRLRESVRGTTMAAGIFAFGTIALVLWPLAIITTALRRK